MSVDKETLHVKRLELREILNFRTRLVDVNQYRAEVEELVVSKL